MAPGPMAAKDSKFDGCFMSEANGPGQAHAYDWRKLRFFATWVGHNIGARYPADMEIASMRRLMKLHVSSLSRHVIFSTDSCVSMCKLGSRSRCWNI